ncbi:sensor domain-containing protein [Flavobacterium sp. MXW15]|uniref:Sensor domain-containing protein n=1 Tax=Xanthomonas chitinilytica TaxID=2989819 RepID=A0ABT3JV01_9XANT|nr:sensor domain-containing protein [Xanthomonas sp. H13-6]MCW4453333.1 sensor domain-containing protein [Flavobacterium sp. MXW15]MCW4472314.1 sensor domain-containing protein [Xanthomonas sp. H13-6]
MNRETEGGRPLPTTIPEYLAQLRAALAGADPAMIQDALYDAEEYLRSELAEQAGKSEAEVIAGVAGSYGAPEEVAEIYRETEITVSRALRTPSAGAAPAVGTMAATAAAAGARAVPPQMPSAGSRSLPGRFFGVALEPRTYGALFYMLLSLATGTFFFTWVVTGLSLSLGLMVLIIGIPVAVLFFGSVRGLSLLEGRLVEALLGERMPRRPPYADRSQGWLQRIGAMFTDGRTWLTLLYFVLMLPLGILYFTIATTLLSLSLGLIWSPIAALFTGVHPGIYINGQQMLPMWLTPVMAVLGVILLFVTLHLARGIGRLHGMMAKHLLVRL